jgi:hypothetical protein
MASSPSRSGFIRQDKETGRWTFIGFEKAKDKVGHALRQASKQKDRKRKELHNHNHNHEVLHPSGHPSLVSMSTASRSKHSNYAEDHNFPRPHPSHYSWYHPCLPPMPVYHNHNAQMDDSQSFKRFKPLSSPSTVPSAAFPIPDNGGARASPSMMNATFLEEVVGPPGSSQKRSAAQSPDPRMGSYQVHTQHTQHTQHPPATSMVSPRGSPRGSPTSVADVGVGNRPCMDMKSEERERYSYSRPPYHHPSSHYLSQHQHGYSYPPPPPNSNHPTHHVAPHNIPPPHPTQQYDMPHQHPSYYPPPIPTHTQTGIEASFSHRNPRFAAQGYVGVDR